MSLTISKQHAEPNMQQPDTEHTDCYVHVHELFTDMRLTPPSLQYADICEFVVDFVLSVKFC